MFCLCLLTRFHFSLSMHNAVNSDLCVFWYFAGKKGARKDNRNNNEVPLAENDNTLDKYRDGE